MFNIIGKYFPYEKCHIQHGIVSLIGKGTGYQCYFPFKCKEIAKLKFFLVHNKSVLNLRIFV